MDAQIRRNKRQTAFLMGLMIVCLAGFGLTLGLFYNYWFTAIFAVGGSLYVFLIYRNSARMALFLTKSKPIAKADNPQLYRLVENLAITAGIPTPKVYIIDDPAANAFATGLTPERASVSVTTGLLEILDKQELEGVIAHEIGHIINYDIRLNCLAFGLMMLAGLTVDFTFNMVAFGDNRSNRDPRVFMIMLAVSIVSIIAIKLIFFAISRQREYLADATGSDLTRYPQGLADALIKIKIRGSNPRRPHQATAHMFFVNPLKSGLWTRLLGTHPPLEDRIRRLTELAGGAI